MTNTPHQLAEEFPDFVGRIHDLKIENAHFLKLFNAYDEVNRAIHRAETEIESTGDMHMEDMRKRRMVLKDEIYGMLTH